MNTYKTNPTVKRLLNTRKATFNITFHPEDNYFTANVASYWDGGSRSTYAVYNVSTGFFIAHVAHDGWSCNGRKDFALPKGQFLVESGIFCGKPATVYVDAYEEDRERLLKLFGNPEGIK